MVMIMTVMAMIAVPAMSSAHLPAWLCALNRVPNPSALCLPAARVRRVSRADPPAAPLQALTRAQDRLRAGGCSPGCCFVRACKPAGRRTWPRGCWQGPGRAERAGPGLRPAQQLQQPHRWGEAGVVLS